MSLKNDFKDIINRYEDLSTQLSSQEILSDSQRFQNISKEVASTQQFYRIASEYAAALKDINDAKELLINELDADIVAFYEKLISDSDRLLASLEVQYNDIKLANNTEDARNAILEIRAGAGGTEAGIFADDLMRMYLKYAETQGWGFELLHTSRSQEGSLKEAIIHISGDKVYGQLKNESGVHRVQRIPSTEASGRIHTSAASVVVLPEVQELDIQIKAEDLRIDTYRAGGPGGQSVNTTDSAIRITHIPSGIVVTCQDEKSQHKNKAKALQVLRSRLYEFENTKKNSELSDTRKKSIRGGDRSVKIKTYNFPQNRLTDHRTKESWHNLSEIINGQIDEVLNSTNKKLLEQE